MGSLWVLELENGEKPMVFQRFSPFSGLGYSCRFGAALGAILESSWSDFGAILGGFGCSWGPPWSCLGVVLGWVGVILEYIGPVLERVGTM